MKKKNLIFVLISGLILLFNVKVLAQNTDNPGVQMFENKNYYGSERYFHDVIKREPANGSAYFYLGRIAMEQKQLDKASGHFDKAIEMDPSNASYYAWAGINYILLLSEVDFMRQAIYAPKARKNLETAVELDPGHIKARIWLAGYYANAPSFAGGSREKAKVQFDKIFAIDPNHKEALLQQGIILANFEEYEEALHSFEKILEQQEDYYPAYFHIGKLSLESNRFYSRGELSLIKFISRAGEEFSSSKDEAWWYLGQIYQHQQKTNEARQAFENAVSLDPENEDYRKSLENIL
jgi:tetratricopeptide (TPR) repeat protein